MKRQITTIGMSFLMLACLLTGCSKGNESKEAQPETEESAVEESATGEAAAEAVTGDLAAEDFAAETAGEAATEAETAAFDFADLSDWVFWFGSGAGGWCTEVSVAADGSFEGNYHDSDMGTTGDDYPNGTVYVSVFSGKFTQPRKVNEYTISLQVESIELEYEIGKEEITDGVKYVFCEPYGMEDAEEVLLYLPGAPIAELPEEYVSWIHYATYDIEDGRLPFYGLYNVKPQNGFSSAVYSEEVSVFDEIEGIEKQIEELEEQRLSETASQFDMNMISLEMYQLWDDELNSIWSRLNETLDEEAMTKLLAEQRGWIADKEAKIKEAGAEYEGGSIQPMIINLTAADLTKERVYELAQLLP